MTYRPSDHMLTLRQVIAAWLLCGLVAAAGFALASASRAEDPAVAVARDHDAVWAKTAARGEAISALPPHAGVVPPSQPG